MFQEILTCFIDISKRRNEEIKTKQKDDSVDRSILKILLSSFLDNSMLANYNGEKRGCLLVLLGPSALPSYTVCWVVHPTHYCSLCV